MYATLLCYTASANAAHVTAADAATPAQVRTAVEAPAGAIVVGIADGTLVIVIGVVGEELGTYVCPTTVGACVDGAFVGAEVGALDGTAFARVRTSACRLSAPYPLPPTTLSVAVALDDEGAVHLK